MSRRLPVKKSSTSRATHKPAGGELPSQRRLPPLLRRAWFGLNQAFRRRISHLGLTPDQFTVLRWLVEYEKAGLTQRELSGLMASDPNTVVAIVQRIESAGWIARHAHETDRRKQRLRITPAGKRLFLAARVHALQLQSRVLEAIPARKRDEFLELLGKVATACTEQD